MAYQFDDTDGYGFGSQNPGMQGQTPQLMMFSCCCMFIAIIVVCIFFPQLLPFQLPWATTKPPVQFPLFNTTAGTTTTGGITTAGVTGGMTTTAGVFSGGATGLGENDLCNADSECSSGCCTSAVSYNDGRLRCAPAGQCSNPVNVSGVANMKWCVAANKGDAPWIQVYKHPKTGYAACIGNGPNTCTWRNSATDYKDLALIKKINDSNGLKCTQVDIGNPNSWCFDAQATLDKNGAQTWKC